MTKQGTNSLRCVGGCPRGAGRVRVLTDLKVLGGVRRGRTRVRIKRLRSKGAALRSRGRRGPRFGRWLSEDPAGSSSDYAYVGDNPLVRIDPSGTMYEGGSDIFGPGDCPQCDKRNKEALRANAFSQDPPAAYEAWLGADRLGKEPPAGWEKYVDFVLAASRATGIPAYEILGVMAAETGKVPGRPNYDPTFVEPPGYGPNAGVGIMQVTPNVAMDLHIDPALLTDPATNIMAGARHLAELHQSYRGLPDELERTLSAYNQGPGGLAKRGLEFNRTYWEKVKDFMEWFRSRYP